MYCPHCGKELADEVAFCPYCGKKLSSSLQSETTDKDELHETSPIPAPAPAPAPTEPEKRRKCVIALVGFCLAFEVPLAGLICSIIGLKRCNARGESWREFAIAGIIISAVAMAIYVLALCIYIPIIIGAFGSLSQWLYAIFNNIAY